MKGIYNIIQIFACCFPGPCFVGLSGYNGCLCKGSQHGRDSLCCYRWSMYWSFCFNFKNTILCYKLSSCSLFSSLWRQPHHWPLRACLIRNYSSYPPIRRWTRGLESWCTSRILFSGFHCLGACTTEKEISFSIFPCGASTLHIFETIFDRGGGERWWSLLNHETRR